MRSQISRSECAGIRHAGPPAKDSVLEYKDNASMDYRSLHNSGDSSILKVSQCGIFLKADDIFYVHRYAKLSTGVCQKVYASNFCFNR